MNVQWIAAPESFTFLRHMWDVGRAKEILIARKKPGKVVQYDIDELRQMLSVPTEKDGVVTGFSIGVGVDWDRIRADIAKPAADQEIKLDVPCILALTPQKNAIVIDGYHRIGKAVLLKVTQLPAVVLTVSESRRCKVL